MNDFIIIIYKQMCDSNKQNKWTCISTRQKQCSKRFQMGWRLRTGKQTKWPRSEEVSIWNLTSRQLYRISSGWSKSVASKCTFQNTYGLHINMYTLSVISKCTFQNTYGIHIYTCKLFIKSIYIYASHTQA